MKKKLERRIVSFMMAVILVIGTLKVPGLTLEVHADPLSGTCGNGVTYVLDGDGLLTISKTEAGDGAITSHPWDEHKDNVVELVIESGVTSIPMQAFLQYEALTKISIAGSVEKIPFACFAECTNLSEINLSVGLKQINSSAFACCDKLKNVAIPESVNLIGSGAFGECEALETITVDAGNQDYCDVSGVLYDKGITSLMQYPCGHANTSYVIPNTVTQIENGAFSSSAKLTQILITANVSAIGASSFKNCTALTSITVPGGVYAIGTNCFSGCSALTSVVIEDGVGTINDYAFADCSSLAAITMPKSIAHIYEGAFEGCGNLTITYNGTEADLAKVEINKGSEWDNITINCTGTEIVANGTCGDYLTWMLDSNGLLTLSGTGAVTSNPWNNSDIRKVVIGSGVTDVTAAGFINCTLLEDFSVEDGNTVYSSDGGVLFNKNKTELIQYPCNKEGEEYTVPDSVTAIGDHAFVLSSKLTSISLPDGVTEIGAGAFKDCNGLKDINIPDSVTDIKMAAFFKCTSLEDISFPDTVTAVKERVFAGCSALNSIAFSDRVTLIEQDAFKNCSSLTDVYYSGAGTQWDNLKNNTGANNTYLTNAKIHYMKGSCGTSATWTLTKEGVLTISGTGEIGEVAGYTWKQADIKEVVIENGVTAIGDGLFWGCNMTSVTIPESVTTIESFAFAECDHITGIVIPGNAITIGEMAFADCSLLKSITIPKNAVIGDEAFDNCNSLTDVYYGGTADDWSNNACVTIGTGNDILEGKVHFTVFVTGVSIAPSTLELRVGESGTLTATVAPENATNKKVSWTNSAPAVATVADGAVTAVAEGETIITVTTEDGGKTATCKVTVAGFPVTGVSIAPETLSLEIGKSGTLTATVAPENATNKKVSWTSSKPEVATVADGVVTAVAEGETDITVTTEDGSQTASCKVTVVKPTEPEKPVEPEIVEGPLGPEKPDLSRYTASGNEIAVKSINLKKTIFKDVKGIKKFNVTAGDETAVKIKGSTLTVLKDATVTIEAVNKKKEKLAEKTITVIAPQVDTTQAGEIYRRGTLDLNKYILSTVQPSAWKSSNKKVATVSENGLLLMKKSGTVKITVTFPAEKGMSAKKLTIKLKIRMPQFKKTTYTVKTGKTVKTAVKNAESSEITYRIEDPSIATVDASGKVTGVSKGTTKLIMRVRDIDYETKIKVK